MGNLNTIQNQPSYSFVFADNDIKSNNNATDSQTTVSSDIKSTQNIQLTTFTATDKKPGKITEETRFTTFNAGNTGRKHSTIAGNITTIKNWGNSAKDNNADVCKTEKQNLTKITHQWPIKKNQNEDSSKVVEKMLLIRRAVSENESLILQLDTIKEKHTRITQDGYLLGYKKNIQHFFKINFSQSYRKSIDKAYNSYHTKETGEIKKILEDRIKFLSENLLKLEKI